MSLSSGKTVCNIQVSYYERVMIMIMLMIINESLNRINPSVLESIVITGVL